MQITSIITLPYNILVHNCKTNDCTHKLKIIKGSYQDIEFYLNPMFKTGDGSETIFPKVKFKDINIGNIRNIREDEFPRILVKRDIPETKECNTLRIDYSDKTSFKKIEKYEPEIISNLLSKFRKNTKQFWIKSSMFSTQKTFESFQLKMKSLNVFSGEFLSDKQKVSPINFPVEMFTLNQTLWVKSLNELNEPIFDLSEFKFMDGLNSINIEDYESMVLNFAISVEINKNLLFKKIWKSLNPKKLNSEYNQKDVGMFNNDLTTHISDTLKNSFINKSFKDDFNNEYKYICYLWKFRGKIAHGEEAKINHDMQNIKIGDLNINELILAVIKANNYLKNLSEEKYFDGY